MTARKCFDGFSATWLRGVIRYDGQTGQVFRIAGTIRRGHPVEDVLMGRPFGPAGHLHAGVGGRNHSLARLIWLYVTGEWPTGYIDHIDGDPQNNRIANLRDVSPRVNSQNRGRPPKHNKTGLMGVHYDSRDRAIHKYRARLHINGKQVSLGTFMTAEEAHLAYMDAKRKLHEGFVPERFNEVHAR
jgi:hypothetical protein